MYNEFDHEAITIHCSTMAQFSPDGIVKFTHNGKIGNFKSADVMNKVKKYGDCLNVSDKGVELGILHINKLLFLDDKEVSEFVYKLIEYALLREEVRRDNRNKIRI